MPTWCEIEKGGGPDLFISITASAKLNSTFDVSLLWRQVEVVPAPKPISIKPTIAAGHIPPPPLTFGTRASGFLTLAAGIAAAASFVIFMTGIPAAAAWGIISGLLWVILRSVSPYAKARKALLGDMKNATAELTRAESEWRSKVDAATKAFADTKQGLSKLRSEYQALPQVFRKEEEELQSKKRENQLKAFLRGHFIEDATIKGIGPGRISVLRSFGIETALDVTPDRVGAVDGFGPARTTAVVGWRRSVEARFRFDPNKAVDPAERAGLAQRQSQRRAAVEAALTKGVTELQQIRSTADQTWQTYQQRYSRAALQRERAVSAASALVLPSWAA